MKRPRSAPKNDQDKIKYALQELKAENRKLRKENNRLKKELERIDPSIPEVERELPAEPEETPTSYCKNPKCRSSDVTIIKAGIFTVAVCDTCGTRTRSRA